MSSSHIETADEIGLDCIARVAAMKQLPVEAVTPESTFEALGLDSLDRTTLAFDVEERYSVEIPESQLHQIQTVGDMIDGVRQLVLARGAAKAEAEPR